MKPFTPFHRTNSATDRTQVPSSSERGRRVLSLLLALLISVPVLAPATAALSMASDEAVLSDTELSDAQDTVNAVTASTTEVELEMPAESTSLIGARSIRTPASPETFTEELADEIVTDTANLLTAEEPETQDTTTLEIPSTDTVSDDASGGDTDRIPDSILYDPDTPLTQEMIAQRIEARMNLQVRGGSSVYYPYPAGSMAVDLYKDGKQILKGQVVDIGGTVYVPVQRFADLFGTFKTVYTEATEQVVITGTNLSVTVKVGDPYITVNERIFYTGKKVISLGGWIFVPLTSMCKAMNASVTIRSGYYDAFITSGDPSKVAWASEYYDSTDLYWLSRIISAEAKGEPFAGQIAVGNVVLNRVRSSQFPNTVKGVIFDTKYGTQFSPVSSGTIYNTPTSSAVMAAKVCLEGYSLSTTMIYFYNPSIATSSWIGRTRPYVMTIGNHKFYA